MKYVKKLSEVFESSRLEFQPVEIAYALYVNGKFAIGPQPDTKIYDQFNIPHAWGIPLYKNKYYAEIAAEMAKNYAFWGDPNYKSKMLAQMMGAWVPSAVQKSWDNSDMNAKGKVIKRNEIPYGRNMYAQEVYDMLFVQKLPITKVVKYLIDKVKALGGKNTSDPSVGDAVDMYQYLLGKQNAGGEAKDMKVAKCRLFGKRKQYFLLDFNSLVNLMDRNDVTIMKALKLDIEKYEPNYTGFHLYEAFAASVGSKEEASKRLAKMGVAGAVFMLGHPERLAKTKKFPGYIVFDPTDVEVLEVMNTQSVQ